MVKRTCHLALQTMLYRTLSALVLVTSLSVALEFRRYAAADEKCRRGEQLSYTLGRSYSDVRLHQSVFAGSRLFEEPDGIVGYSAAQ